MPASDEEIREAWNAILVGPYAYAQRLTSLAARGRRVALLSNTNRIHHEHFKSQTEKVFEPMERLFFSYEIGSRKPDPQAFMHVVEKTGFRPENTLFVEDTPANVESARRLGFRVYAVGDPWRMNAELSAWLETGTMWEKI
jgi:putative hydrolase of the HAD superfamily